MPKEKKVQETDNDSKLAEMEEKIAQLERLLKRQGQESPDEKIEAYTYIDLVSLSPIEITLTTEKYGRGSQYTFGKYGDIRQITFENLQKVIQNHEAGVYNHFISDGWVYIKNYEVVKRCGLTDVYEKLLDKEDMDEVIKCRNEKAATLYKNANLAQRRNAAQMLINKCAYEEDVDLNILDKISRIFGENIQKLGVEAKSYLDMNLKG